MTIGVAGKLAKSFDDLVAKRFGAWCFGLLKVPSSEEVREDVEISSRLYGLYEMAKRAYVEYACNSARSRIAISKAKWVRRAKAF